MANKKKHKSKFSFRRLVYNDKYLIIFSIILALVVWIGASLNIGTDESKTIRVNVPIELGDEVSEQLGMQYYSLQETIDLSVSISGPKYVIGQVEADDLAVKFDTSSVNRTGQQTIPVLVTNKSNSLDFDISSVYPSSIEGYFDVNESRVIDVSLSYDKSAIGDGYVFGTPVLSEDKVVISGPKTYVDKVESASVKLNFGTDKVLTEPYNEDCKINIEGSGVETSYLTIASRTDIETPISNISVTLPVLKKTTLPVRVNIDDIPKGISQKDYSVSYSVNKIEAGVLDSADINYAVLGNISFNQLSVGTNVFEFDATKIQGITVLDDRISVIKVTIKISNDYSEKFVSVDKNSILVEGVPKGYKAVIKSISSNNIAVVSSRNITSIRPSEIDMKCDVSEPNENNIYDIVMNLNDDNNSWIHGHYTAVIELVSE